MKSFISLFTKRSTRGFVLPLTLIICVIILTIATGISVILAKELYFSKLSRLSQIAYYAADNGVMCATMIDDQYIDPETGMGIFPYSNTTDDASEMEAVLDKVDQDRQIRGLSQVGSINNIKCATASIFNPIVTGFNVSSFIYNSESGKTSTFSMRMDLGDGTYRCATVVVNKTPSYRQIISRGFASCGTVFTYPIERAVVSTAESTDTAAPSQQVFVLTSGNSWTVPQGVSSIKVWAIGGGGGGGGAGNDSNESAGGGGAGGLAYRTFTVTPGSNLSYSIGSGGTGGINFNNGQSGGETNITISGTTLRGRGGQGGDDDGDKGNGGSASNGSTNSTGGDGGNTGGNNGGAGGGGIGNNDALSNNGCTGTSGSSANDVQGLFAALTIAGISTTGTGTGGACDSNSVNTSHGGNATGFGAGGGGAGRYGGSGGDGVYGGGGGGAAGGTQSNLQGGDGGSGVIVIQVQ